jgi:hypothetical protein
MNGIHPEPHLWPALHCRFCGKALSGEAITEDSGETWAHLKCWQTDREQAVPQMRTT